MNTADVKVNNKANRKPDSIIYEYRITTDEMREFVSAKANHLKTNLKAIIAIDIWKRRGKVYPSMKMSLSEEALKVSSSEYSFYHKIAIDKNENNFVDPVTLGLIEKYGFNEKAIRNLLDNSKELDRIEDDFGVNETNINAIREIIKPKAITYNGRIDETWYVMAVRPEAIILDMLSEKGTDMVLGDFVISEYIPISKENVEAVVHVKVGNKRKNYKVDPELMKLIMNV